MEAQEICNVKFYGLEYSAYHFAIRMQIHNILWTISTSMQYLLKLKLNSTKSTIGVTLFN